MKSTTNVWIAIRNIGDATDAGKSYEASLNQAILWAATELAQISMAGRIVVGIGRSQEDALRGINVKSAGQKVLNEDMQAMLDSVFNGETNSEEFLERAGTARVAGDDYVA